MTGCTNNMMRCEMEQEIESLRQQLAECQKKKLTQKYTMLKRAVSAEQQLAESQAREKVLRDALSAYPGGWANDVNKCVWDGHRNFALDTPFDSTALNSAIKQAKRDAYAEKLPEIENLMGEYWALAFEEGKLGTNRATDANAVLHILRRLAAEQTPTTKGETP